MPACANCKAQFEIEPDDSDFYAKLNVPPPAWCWKCRFARRLLWRNERSLYKRPCDLCYKDIISMYRKEAAFPVYCHECWWSDKWDALEYGREYDPTKPFFAQFAELAQTVPHLALYATDNVNSDYCSFTAHLKNCYLMFGSWFSEDCGYGQTVLESRDCWNCLFIKNCESCLYSVDCQKCFKVHFSRNSASCSDSVFLFDCRNCQNCLFSWNLRNKSYCVFNRQLSKEEYAKALAEMTGSAAALEKSLADFSKLVREKALHRFYTGEHNQNVSGEFIYNCKNVRRSYYINDGENEKYAVRGGKGEKDAMDVFGVHAGELAYDCNNIDFSSRALFCVNGEDHHDTSYAVDCFNVSDLFGCYSLRKKKNCILNKQYGEKEYAELKARIVAEMTEKPYVDKRGVSCGYGELFPIDIAPFAYNESIAQEWLPLTAAQAKELGYAWMDLDEKAYVETKSWRGLPGSIGETADDILNEMILCRAWETDKEKAQEHKCTKAFRLTRDELAAYRKFGLALPRTCPNTRNFELGRLRNPVEFHERQCGCRGKGPGSDREAGSQNGYANTAEHFHGAEPCPNKFTTAYAPDRPEIVYCEECYQAEVA